MARLLAYLSASSGNTFPAIDTLLDTPDGPLRVVDTREKPDGARPGGWYYRFDFSWLNEALEGERLAAVVALVGAVDVPIIHLSVYYFNTIHPKPVTFKPEAPTAALALSDRLASSDARSPAAARAAWATRTSSRASTARRASSRAASPARAGATYSRWLREIRTLWNGPSTRRRRRTTTTSSTRSGRSRGRRRRRSSSCSTKACSASTSRSAKPWSGRLARAAAPYHR